MKKFLRSVIVGLAQFLPASLFISTYIFLSKNSVCKKILNSIIKLILPHEVVIPEGTLLLNPEDAVVSGAIAFGVYEQYEVSLFRSILKPGMVVVDIGANIGYFTLIAARAVGPTGTVLAFEPDKTNFDFLEKTVKLNNFSNTQLHNVALGNKNEVVQLFLSSTNKGDHRIYNVTNEHRSAESVTMVTLDSVMESIGVTTIDVIKMDVQGAEGVVLEGAQQCLKMNPNITILTEFWPDGLRSTGVDPEKILASLLDNHAVYEMNEKTHSLDQVFDCKAFVNKFSGRQYTNLLCRSK